MKYPRFLVGHYDISTDRYQYEGAATREEAERKARPYGETTIYEHLGSMKPGPVVFTPRDEAA